MNGILQSLIMKMCRTVLGALILSTDFIASADATQVGISAPSQITGLNTYSDYGGGDVIFTIATAVSTCQDGFWLRPTDAGFMRNFSVLMGAYLSGKALRVVDGYNDQLWPGSGGKICRVVDIGL